MKNLYHYIFGILALLSFIACNNPEVNKNESLVAESSAEAHTLSLSQNQYKLADVQMGKVVHRSLDKLIKLNGTVEASPSSQQKISLPLGGYITDMQLMVGQVVKKNQLVARIENREFIKLQSDYIETKSTFRYLTKEYERQYKLRKNEINSEKTFQKINNELTSTKAKLKGLEVELDWIGIDPTTLTVAKITKTVSLRAPITGYISAINVSNGAYAAPQDVLFEIVNIDGIYLNLRAFENDIQALSVGQQIKFSTVDTNQYDREATISIVGKSINEDHSIPVTGKINKVSKVGLLPGMNVKTWISISDIQQSVVPTDAIIHYTNKTYILAEKSSSKDRVEFQLVQIRPLFEEGIYTAIELPDDFDIEHTSIVTQNAYVVIAKEINAQEGEE